MTQPIRFPFTSVNQEMGEAGFRPFLPIALTNGDRVVMAEGLLDTGAMVNVLPYEIGLELGFVWSQQKVPLDLAGNLGQQEARAVVVQAVVGQFEPVQLVFAWTKATSIPLLLGQVNFFIEFDICFQRSQLNFEVNPKNSD
jgi:hypothetical protein